MAETKWVYGFDEVADAEKRVGGDWDGVRALLGGKGANLGDMTRLGVPVPPGFTVTTEACLAYLAGGEQFPPGCWDQIEKALERVEKATGKRFGDPDEPAAGLLPLRRQVLHARDDGHRPQHRPQRRGGRRPGPPHRRRALRLRLLPPPRADVRLRGAGPARRAVRRGPRAPAPRRPGWPTTPSCPAERLKAIVADVPRPGPRLPRPTPASSCAWPPRPSSSRGTASAPSTTATPPASPTTWAPR